MIHRTGPAWQTPEWQTALAQAFTEPEALFEYLGLDRSRLPSTLAASRRFRMKIPRSYAALMTRGDPGDPLLRQVLPSAEELLEVAGFCTDPVGDLATQEAPGLLHKYHGRALLITTGACAVNCRYCFRRHYPYAGASAHRDGWRGALAYVAAHPEISEVILSGGDPLTLSDQRLGELCHGLGRIPHLHRLRIHTRLPVLLPGRITKDLLTLIMSTGLQTVMVLHVNHPREVTGELAGQMRLLGDAGITLLNQSVLLRGVNDRAATLVELSEALFSAGILPYYLHLLDRVEGAAHFEVERSGAHAIHEALKARLPGYLVPRLVYEQVGAPSKIHMP
ncbi:MAG: EF-P beta-lysylation protein EpmB [gamma proteobacterium symbiont of Phacoides pectinatus]